MSWSVGAVGKAPAVRGVIAKQFAGSKCTDLEEKVRLAAAAFIDASLAVQDENVAVKVSAQGSQSTDSNTRVISNQVTIAIEPIFGFLS